MPCHEDYDHDRMMGVHYDEDDWIFRLHGCWTPPNGESRAEFEVLPPRWRPPVNRRVVSELFSRCGNRCEKCGVKGLPSQFELHHLHYRTVGTECQWDLLVLCPDCHKKQHIGNDGEWWTDTEQHAAWDWMYREMASSPSYDRE